jgi:hypothetical protein
MPNPPAVGRRWRFRSHRAGLVSVKRGWSIDPNRPLSGVGVRSGVGDVST